MIVEFIGTTGAGKTTLITGVQRALADLPGVSMAFDVAAAPLGLGRVAHPTAQNLIQEAAGLPFFLGSLGRHRRFLAFMGRMLARHGRPSFATVHYLRSIERTIGVYELTRRRAAERVVLVDEGTIVLAHNIFVFTEASYPPEDIATFARLVPLADLIVHVTAPTEALVSRALRRPAPPREMRSRNPALVERYIGRAVAMFEQLAAHECVRDRILTVENPELGENSAPAVDAIVACIRSKARSLPLA